MGQSLSSDTSRNRKWSNPEEAFTSKVRECEVDLYFRFPDVEWKVFECEVVDDEGVGHSSGTVVAENNRAVLKPEMHFSTASEIRKVVFKRNVRLKCEIATNHSNTLRSGYSATSTTASESSAEGEKRVERILSI
eukprot:Lankesteria_metandrocarpae@DN7639_c0_g1_i1.p1